MRLWDRAFGPAGPPTWALWGEAELAGLSFQWGQKQDQAPTLQLAKKNAVLWVFSLIINKKRIKEITGTIKIVSKLNVFHLGSGSEKIAWFSENDHYLVCKCVGYASPPPIHPHAEWMPFKIHCVVNSCGSVLYLETIWFLPKSGSDYTAP